MLSYMYTQHNTASDTHVDLLFFYSCHLLVMTFTRQYQSAEPISIQRRRIDESNKQVLHNIINQQKQRENIARWEHTVLDKQSNNITATLVNGIKQQQSVQLQLRRNRLSELLHSEDVQYRNELQRCNESASDRLQKKLQHARELKSQREQRRQQYVTQQYQLLYTMNCDELRTINSQHYNHYIAEQQRKQVKSNQLNKQHEQLSEQQWQLQYAAEHQQKLAEDERIAQQRKNAMVENRNIIQEQLDEKQRFKQLEQQRIHNDKLEMNQRIADNNRIAAQQQLQQNQRNALLRRQIAAYNEQLDRERQLELQQRKQREHTEIQEKVEQYKQDTAAKNEHARQLYNDMTQYRQYLQQQKLEQQQHEREIERLVQDEMNKYYAAKDEQYLREKQARERLLEDVLQQRQQQLDDKQQLKQQQLNEQQLLKQQYQAEYDDMIRQQQIDLQNKYITVQQRKAELAEQQNELKQRKLIESNELKLQQQQVKQAETEYNALLEHMRNNTISQAQNKYGTRKIM